MFLLTTGLAPQMAERGHGSIINVSSASGTRGSGMDSVYGATKAAVNSQTRAWATEYGPSGVSVNAIAPGPVCASAPTEMLESFIPLIPLRRVAQPEEIAEVIAFLAGPGGSCMSGATIPVDGGRTAV